MDKMERIARHYLGERLIRVEHTPDNKPPFQVVYNSGSEYHDGLYGNNVEEMCIRIATELKSRGWVPTHERLGWEHDAQRRWNLCLYVGTATLPIARIMSLAGSPQGRHCVPTLSIPTARGDVRNLWAGVTEVAEWCNKNLPYYLPSFPENKQ